jgi:hypothetical protein
MPRLSRAAAIQGEAKRRTGVAEDPGYASDSICDAYLDFDHVGGKFRCHPKAEGGGLYHLMFIDDDGKLDGFETKHVHWDSDHGKGHGIWRRELLFEEVHPHNRSIGDKPKATLSLQQYVQTDCTVRRATMKPPRTRTM